MSRKTSVMPSKSFCVDVQEQIYGTICRSISGLTPCPYGVVDS